MPSRRSPTHPRSTRRSCRRPLSGPGSILSKACATPTRSCWRDSGGETQNRILNSEFLLRIIRRREMSQIGIMQVTDTLAAGGTERVAINIANPLPRDRYRVHLCTTRSDGPLASQLAGDVGRICLYRKRTLDLSALRRMADYIRANDIAVLH